MKKFNREVIVEYVIISLLIIVGAIGVYLGNVTKNVNDAQMTEQPMILESGMNYKQSEFLLNIGKLLVYAEEIGFGQNGLYITAGEMYRTRYQQAEHIRRGRSQTWNSNHLRRLAFDINIIQNGQVLDTCPELEMLGDYWESLNPRNKWGGHYRNWKDNPHFEYRP